MTYEKHVYIIAEAGVNHNGSVEIAKQLIDVAVDAGVDAIKFQTFKTDNIISAGVPKAEYQVRTTGSFESQYEMLKKLELGEEAFQVLKEYCDSRKIQFLSTPFDLESLDLLVKKFDLPIIKIPSGEITNAPLLLLAAGTNKPIIVSTGMCNLGEIEEALGILAYGYLDSNSRPSLESFKAAYNSKEGQKTLVKKVTLLHCTTEYPAPFEDVNLRAINTLNSAFGLPVGLSDHTPGIAVSIAAVAFGASVIEKHFTLDKNLTGPDHKASLNPDELKTLVKSIREVELAMGERMKIPAPSEFKNKTIARKSLVAALDIKKGDLFTELNLTTKRPGTGVSPLYYWEWLGKTAGKDYKKDEMIGL